MERRSFLASLFALAAAPVSALVGRSKDLEAVGRETQSTLDSLIVGKKSTLLDEAKRSQGSLVQAVVDNITQVSPMFEVMPFEEVNCIDGLRLKKGELITISGSSDPEDDGEFSDHFKRQHLCTWEPKGKIDKDFVFTAPKVELESPFIELMLTEVRVWDS